MLWLKLCYVTMYSYSLYILLGGDLHSPNAVTRDVSSSKLKIKTRHDEDGDTSPQSVLHATGFIT